MTSVIQPHANIKSQRRGALGRHPSLTGIDYIEVRPVTLGQWELLLHFVPSAPEIPQRRAIPPGIASDNIAIRGRGGAADARLSITSITYPENGGNILTVAVTRTGADDVASGATGFPVYTLQLVHVPDIDRYFSSGSFTLDVSAFSDLHPGPPGTATPGLAPATPIDYLAKDYESFRKLVLDRMTDGCPSGPSATR